jgi:hypothetical protein
LHFLWNIKHRKQATSDSTTVILVTWEAEISRIILNQLGKKKKKRSPDPISVEKKLVVVVCTCDTNYNRKHK